MASRAKQGARKKRTAAVGRDHVNKGKSPRTLPKWDSAQRRASTLQVSQKSQHTDNQAGNGTQKNLSLTSSRRLRVASSAPAMARPDVILSNICLNWPCSPARPASESEKPRAGA